MRSAIFLHIVHRRSVTLFSFRKTFQIVMENITLLFPFQSFNATCSTRFYVNQQATKKTTKLRANENVYIKHLKRTDVDCLAIIEMPSLALTHTHTDTEDRSTNDFPLYSGVVFIQIYSLPDRSLHRRETIRNSWVPPFIVFQFFSLYISSVTISVKVGGF